MERQVQGFEFEKFCERNFGIRLECVDYSSKNNIEYYNQHKKDKWDNESWTMYQHGYTDTFDGIETGTTYNYLLDTIGERDTFPYVSIKAKKWNGALCLGDIFRQFEHAKSGVDFAMYIKSYKDDDNFTVYRLEIEHDFWYDQFRWFEDIIYGDDFVRLFNRLDSSGNEIPMEVFHSHDYDQEWRKRYRGIRSQIKEVKNKFVDEYLSSNCDGMQMPDSIITVNGKRDHKKQLRCQCSIPNRFMVKIFNNKYAQYGCRCDRIMKVVNGFEVPLDNAGITRNMK